MESKPRGLCIATRCKTADELVEKLAPCCDEGWLFVNTNTVRPIGSEAPLAVMLADRTVVLRGWCVVFEAWSTSDNPFGKPGMRLGVHRLTPSSMDVFERMLAMRKAAISQGRTVRHSTQAVAIVEMPVHTPTMIGIPAITTPPCRTVTIPPLAASPADEVTDPTERMATPPVHDVGNAPAVEPPKSKPIAPTAFSSKPLPPPIPQLPKPAAKSDAVNRREPIASEIELPTMPSAAPNANAAMTKSSAVVEEPTVDSSTSAEASRPRVHERARTSLGSPRNFRPPARVAARGRPSGTPSTTDEAISALAVGTSPQGTSSQPTAAEPVAVGTSRSNESSAVGASPPPKTIEPASALDESSAVGASPPPKTIESASALDESSAVGASPRAPRSTKTAEPVSARSNESLGVGASPRTSSRSKTAESASANPSRSNESVGVGTSPQETLSRTKISDPPALAVGASRSNETSVAAVATSTTPLSMVDDQAVGTSPQGPSSRTKTDDVAVATAHVKKTDDAAKPGRRNARTPNDRVAKATPAGSTKTNDAAFAVGTSPQGTPVRVASDSDRPVRIARASATETRTPGSPLVLPANPLMDLTDASLEGFVDCRLYEELSPTGEPEPERIVAPPALLDTAKRGNTPTLPPGPFVPTPAQPLLAGAAHAPAARAETAMAGLMVAQPRTRTGLPTAPLPISMTFPIMGEPPPAARGSSTETSTAAITTPLIASGSSPYMTVNPSPPVPRATWRALIMIAAITGLVAFMFSFALAHWML